MKGKVIWRLQASKKTLKSRQFFTLVLIYGLVAYQLGKSTNLTSLLAVKGATTTETFDSPQESPAPYADSQSQAIISSFVKLCANTTHAFEIAYPKDWFTTYNTEADKCTFFAPYSFIVPQDSENFQVPIRIEVISPQDWQTVVKLSENPNEFQNVLSIENLQVGGYLVEKIEAQTTNFSAKQGYAKVSYLIFDGAKPMIVAYQQLDEKEDFKKAKEVLAEMVTSLKIF